MECPYGGLNENDPFRLILILGHQGVALFEGIRRYGLVEGSMSLGGGF